MTDQKQPFPSPGAQPGIQPVSQPAHAPAARGSLQPLFDPRAIAVLGASGDPEKLNGRTVRALVDKKFARGV